MVGDVVVVVVVGMVVVGVGVVVVGVVVVAAEVGDATDLSAKGGGPDGTRGGGTTLGEEEGGRAMCTEGGEEEGIEGGATVSARRCLPAEGPLVEGPLAEGTVAAAAAVAAAALNGESPSSLLTTVPALPCPRRTATRALLGERGIVLDGGGGTVTMFDGEGVAKGVVRVVGVEEEVTAVGA